MATLKNTLRSVDPLWDRIRAEAQEAVQSEPLLGGLIHSSLLHHDSVESALAYRLALKLASGEMSEQLLREIMDEAYAGDPHLADAARADLAAIYERDPACHRLIQPILLGGGSQGSGIFLPDARVGGLWD